MIYSVKELISVLEDLKEQGYKTLSLVELLEAIGWEKEDVEELLRLYEDRF